MESKKRKANLFVYEQRLVTASEDRGPRSVPVPEISLSTNTQALTHPDSVTVPVPPCNPALHPQQFPDVAVDDACAVATRFDGDPAKIAFVERRVLVCFRCAPNSRGVQALAKS